MAMDTKMTAPASRSRGLSLIEMMIAITLGAIVTVGVVQMFVANSQTYNLLIGQSRMQESARFALAFVGRAVRAAGYKGCYSTNGDVATTLDPADALPYEFDIRTAIDGYNGDPTTGDWTFDIHSILPRTVGGTSTNVYQYAKNASGVIDYTDHGIDTTTIVRGTDVLTTRTLSNTDYPMMQNIPLAIGDPIIALPAGGLADLEFYDGHMVMVSDCENATIFRVTGRTANSPATGLVTIGHDLADTDAQRNASPQLATVNTFSTNDAQVNAIETNIFYIAPGAGRNNLGNTPLSLWRKTGLAEPIELVEGVEDMQILFGVDDDEDGVPNTYVAPNGVSDFNQVVTVRVTFTVNSIDDVGGRSTPTHTCTVQDCISGETYDGLIRRSFTQTFKLRNHG